MIVLVYQLFCDECGARYWTATRSATMTRVLARDAGWQCRRESEKEAERDLCGECAAGAVPR